MAETKMALAIHDPLGNLPDLIIEKVGSYLHLRCEATGENFLKIEAGGGHWEITKLKVPGDPASHVPLNANGYMDTPEAA